MRVLVCGGRNYYDFPKVEEVLSRYTITSIVHGGATGADSLAQEYADDHHIPTLVFEADWSKHGKAAGPIRNEYMIVDGKPDLVVAFPGGRGTADMVRKAHKAGIRVHAVIGPSGNSPESL